MCYSPLDAANKEDSVSIDWQAKRQEWTAIFWQLLPVMTALAVLAYGLSYCWELCTQLKPGLIRARDGMPLGGDFISLWSAGHLAATGNPVGAYDPATMSAAHRVAVPATTLLTLFHYPPSALLFLLPFGAIGYVPALLLFVGLSFGWFFFYLWRARPHWSTALLVLGYPAVWLNILSGQNSFLSGALIGLALYARSPFWQGVGWGLLTYKPQLGLPVPFALLLARSFKTIGWSLLIALLLALAAGAAFGTGTYRAFLADTDLAWHVLAAGMIPLERMASSFSAVLLATQNVSAALAAQMLTTLIGLCSVIALWRTPGTAQSLRCASLITAMVMATPHLFHYDLALMALPLLLVLQHAESSRWLAGERCVLFMIWVGPFIALPSSGLIDVNFYFLLLILLQLVMLRRARTLNAAS